MRPKVHGFPPYMKRDGDGFRVLNPITGKRKRFANEADARAAAAIVNEALATQKKLRAFAEARPTVAMLVDRYMVEAMHLMPWDATTRKKHAIRMARIKRELGERLIGATDSLVLLQWLTDTCGNHCKADLWNKWRYELTLLWDFALEHKLAEVNEARKVRERSVSLKIKQNRKVRAPLDLEGFREVHAHAPPWLQLAMELSLLTLQGRTEVCNMRHADFRDGHLYVIRDKVSGDSDMAFIRIALNAELEELRRRALLLDEAPAPRVAPMYEAVLQLAAEGLSVAQMAERLHMTPKRLHPILWWARRRHAPQARRIVSPYLVHRVPDRTRRDWTDGKPHWTYVTPDYLSDVFREKARAACPRWAGVPSRLCPSFHEIRGLGARECEKRGMDKRAIQALMTHSNPGTTAIYLQGGREALRDEHFVKVATGITLREVLGR